MDTEHDFIPIKKSDPDPAGSGLMGWSPQGVDLSSSVHATILYKGKHGQFLLEADIYKIPGAPMYLNIFCPVCRNSLRIGQENKAMDVDFDRVPSFPGMDSAKVLAHIGRSTLGPTLSVEPFKCTWELEPELRRSYGFGVCNWSVAIDNNIAKDV